MACIFDQVGTSIANNQNFSIAVSVFALASAGFTAGASLSAFAAGGTVTLLNGLVLTSGIVSTGATAANLFVINGLNNNTLTPSQAANLQTWNNVYATILIVDAGLNLITPLKTIARESGLVAEFSSLGNFLKSKIFNRLPKNGGLTVVAAEASAGGNAGSKVFNITNSSENYVGISSIIEETSAAGNTTIRIPSYKSNVRTINRSEFTNSAGGWFDGTGALKTQPNAEMFSVPMTAPVVSIYRDFSPLPSTVANPLPPTVILPNGSVGNLTYWTRPSQALSSSVELILAAQLLQDPVVVFGTEKALDDQQFSD
jgi:hypothetical protein